MGNTPQPGSAAAFPPPPGLKTLWELKIVYKLIMAKQLAPFFPYIDDEEATVHAEECPICLNFVIGGMNRSKCCNKGLCTACYITIKKTPTTPIGCPFCLGPSLEVEYRGPKSAEQIESELDDERKVADLKRQIREEEIESDRLRELKRAKEREEARQRAIQAEAAKQAARTIEAQRAQKMLEDEDEELAAAMRASLTIEAPTSQTKTPPVAASPSPRPPPTPPNSPNAPTAPSQEQFPQHILRTLNNPAATEEERDSAELEAAVWLSLHSGTLEQK